jgi:phage shock protein E
MKKILSALLFVFPLFALAGTPTKEVYELVKSNKAIIIDVREENEIKEGMLEKATWYPLSKIEKDKSWAQDLTKLSKDKKVFLYCRSGRRSAKVQDLLKTQGITSENIGGYEDLKKQISAEEKK